MAGLFGPPDYLRCCCGGDPCCPSRCNTVAGESCENPLPLTLTATITVSTVKTDPISGIPTGCYSCTGTLFLSPIDLYIGNVTGTCTGWCGGTTRVFDYEVRVQCGINPSGRISWFVGVQDNITGDPARVCTIPIDQIVWAELLTNCDPILLSGRSTAFLCTDLTCVIPLLGIDEMFGEVRFDILVSEDPP
jgi:hypothetical protein